MSALPDVARYGAGHTMRRVEDPALVQGQGCFTDDVSLPGQTYLAFVRSERAHARIGDIDSSAALAMPGVLRVFTGAELAAAGVKPIPVAVPFKRPDGGACSVPPKRPLAHQVVRYVGEPVAAVIAESRETAAAAAAAVIVAYDELAAVTGVSQAVRAGAPAVWPDAPDNIACESRYGDAAATEAAFQRATYRVSLDLVNQRLSPSSMEPRSVLAYVDQQDGQPKLTLRMSSQMPTGVRTALCDTLPGCRVDNVRVLVGDVGGGFGMKTGAYPEDLVLGWAALQLQRPVKWQATRLEDFLSAVHGRDQISHAELALDHQGHALALRVRTLANIGACPSGSSMVIPLLVGPWVSTSIYNIPTIDLHLSAVLTNQAPTGAYRGAGRPEAIYIIERLMDASAREMGIDPAELRRRNMLRPEQLPYTTPMQQVYDSGNFERILDQGLELADWHGFDERRAASQAAGMLRGLGIATFLEWTGGGMLDEKVSVAVTADGFIELTAATLPMGQGIATSYVQLAHDVFGIPPDRIRVLLGDTDRANGFGSAGSRSLFTGGAAVRVASQRTLEEGRQLAAQALEAPAADIEYRAGRFEVAGTDLGIGLFELAGRQDGARLVVSGQATAGAPSWPNGCHVAEVEIDPQTGHVAVVAYASVNDIGRIVSPGIVRGQIEGGAAQGIGQALFEKIAYDPDSGQLLSASYMDYAMPRVDGFTGFKTAFDESQPCLTNALGAKGVGELGTIGATPAVVNAVVDALARHGLGRRAEQVQMPLTSEVVWRALQGDLPLPLELPR
ncbi:MAG TPA: xanthine dehydrogenase family protein molybdopterin-binding subunit [Rubrivivax sp.]|nr:xanthine dehydrogenase family protein molybdopterin-binding subunit [Rubrivivax sp.]